MPAFVFPMAMVSINIPCGFLLLLGAECFNQDIVKNINGHNQQSRSQVPGQLFSRKFFCQFMLVQVVQDSCLSLLMISCSLLKKISIYMDCSFCIRLQINSNFLDMWLSGLSNLINVRFGYFLGFLKKDAII